MDLASTGQDPVSHIALWDGSSWSSPAGGLEGIVRALCVFRGALYAGLGGGNLDDTGWGKLFRWDGAAWEQIGPTLNGWIMALEVYQNRLVVAGAFTHIGALEVNRIAAWDNEMWHTLADGVRSAHCVCHIGCECQTPRIRDLTVYNGSLVACGHFLWACDGCGLHIARWNGVYWTGMEKGM